MVAAQKRDHFQIIDSLNSLGLDAMDKITLIEYVKDRYVLLDGNNRLCSRRIFAKYPPDFTIGAVILWPIL